jgi:hypothetical protein
MIVSVYLCHRRKEDHKIILESLDDSIQDYLKVVRGTPKIAIVDILIIQ